MGSTINILMIEDESTVQSIVASFLNRYLSQQNIICNVKTYDDPIKGLFELSTNGSHYQAIFLDVHLPKVSGDEIYNSIMHVTPELMERVMFITGFADDLKQRFPESKLNILQKPFRYENFCEQFNALLKSTS